MPQPRPQAIPGTPRAAVAAGRGDGAAPPGPARAPGTPARPGGSLSPGCGDRRAILGTPLYTGPPRAAPTGARARQFPTLGLSFPIRMQTSRRPHATPGTTMRLEQNKAPGTEPGLEPARHAGAATCVMGCSLCPLVQTLICRYRVWGERGKPLPLLPGCRVSPYK